MTECGIDLSVARYIERWMNINMHDSTEVSARKHDKQIDLSVVLQ
jgi:hypothetical protein